MTTDSTTSKTIDIAIMPLCLRQIFTMGVVGLGQFIGHGITTLVGIVNGSRRADIFIYKTQVK